MSATGVAHEPAHEPVRRALESVVTIAVTPFAADGSVDYDAYAAVVEHCIGAGVVAVTPNGNTGEFYSLTSEEQHRSVVTTIRTVGDRATVIAGIGHDPARAVEMARQAAYHEQIARAVPDLGVVCYVRNPDLTGATFRHARRALPNVLGVKYAVPDPTVLPALIQAVGPGRWVWVCGLAEPWAPCVRSRRCGRGGQRPQCVRGQGGPGAARSVPGRGAPADQRADPGRAGGGRPGPAVARRAGGRAAGLSPPRQPARSAMEQFPPPVAHLSPFAPAR
jgi:hypothetical protein